MTTRTSGTAKTTIIIPARLESTRLPGKLLLDCGGKSLLQRTYEQCGKSQAADQVIITTNSTEILMAASAFGARVVTSYFDFRCGSDRVADAAQQLGLEGNVINVQGDEPEIDPLLIDEVAATLERYGAPTTAAAPLYDWAEIHSRHVTKVVFDAEHRSLLFSRSPIPSHPDCPEQLFFLDGQPTYHRHIGIYGWPAWALRRHAELPPSKLERMESLEQLRIMEHGISWRVVVAKEGHPGIDTREQLEAYCERLAAPAC